MWHACRSLRLVMRKILNFLIYSRYRSSHDASRRRQTKESVLNRCHEQCIRIYIEDNHGKLSNSTCNLRNMNAFSVIRGNCKITRPSIASILKASFMSSKSFLKKITWIFSMHTQGSNMKPQKLCKSDASSINFCLSN